MKYATEHNTAAFFTDCSGRVSTPSGCALHNKQYAPKGQVEMYRCIAVNSCYRLTASNKEKTYVLFFEDHLQTEHAAASLTKSGFTVNYGVMSVPQSSGTFMVKGGRTFRYSVRMVKEITESESIQYDKYRTIVKKESQTIFRFEYILEGVTPSGCKPVFRSSMFLRHIPDDYILFGKKKILEHNL